jgi:hypothetical protein
MYNTQKKMSTLVKWDISFELLIIKQNLLMKIRFIEIKYIYILNYIKIKFNLKS